MKTTSLSTVRNKPAPLGFFLAAVAFVLIATQTAPATLLDTGAGVGQFNFTTEGQIMGASGDTYFNNGGSGSSSSVNFTTNALLTRLGYNLGFGNLPASAKGMKFPPLSPQTAELRGHVISTAQPAASGNFVYMTCLLRINTAPNALRGLLGLNNNTSNPSSIQPGVLLMVDPSGKIGISKNTFTAIQSSLYPAASLVGTGVHLVVMRYDFIGAVAPANDDTVNLWLDPDLSTFGLAETSGSFPTPNLTIGTGTTDVTTNGIRSVIAFTANVATLGGDIDIDEIRVGTTWADVLPAPSTCVPPVVINNSPAAIATNAGVTVTLNSTVTAGDNLGILPTLQWQRWDGVSTWTNITDATNLGYTTPTLAVSDNGAQYRVYSTNGCNALYTTNSATNTLSVVTCNDVVISTNPASGTVSIGASTNLSVGVSGSLPVYQWQQWDGVSTWTNIPNANSSSYTTPALQLSDSGVQYRCHVTSGCNASTADSTAATITVSCGNATVSSNPASATTTVGAPAIFTVGYSGPAPTYQWESSTDSGATWGPVASATFASYTNTSALLTDDNTRYRCVLTVVCSSTTATSAPAVLTVVAPSTARYRSVATGNWSDPGTWECSYNGGSTWVVPFAGPSDANDTIQVRSNHVVTVTNSVSADQATVDSGATLNVSSGVTVTVSGSGTQLDVSGILKSAGIVTATGNIVFESGGKYQHNWTTSLSGGIPTATWSTGSTCEVIGFTTVHGTWTAGNLGQSFYNFTWDCANYADTSDGIVLDGALTTVNGNFTHNHGSIVVGSTSASTCTLTVAGNVTFAAPSGFGKVLLSDATANTVNLNIRGNLTVNSGTRVDPFNPSPTSITFTGTNCVFTNGASPRWNDNERTISWYVATGAKLTLQTALVSGSTLLSAGLPQNPYGATVDGTLDVNGNTCSFLNLTGASSGIITNRGAACNMFLGYGASGGLQFTSVLLSGEYDGTIAGNVSVVKQGNTRITLSGTNTFTGATLVTNGVLLLNGSLGAGSSVTVSNGATLSGTGTIGGPATIVSSGILNAGLSGVGTITFNGDLTFDASATSIFAMYSGTSNAVYVGGVLTPGSSIVQINSDLALAAGTYPLFSHYGSFSGSFAAPLFNNTPGGNASIVGAGSQVNLVISSGPTGPGTITNSVSGSTLTLTWPAGQGWRLESQTNILVTSPWVTVPGGIDGSNSVTIDPNNPTMFYRLVYP